MECINSFEEILRHPGRDIINWEYIVSHPEAKYPIWQKYQLDSLFHKQIDSRLATNAYFKMMFYKHFSSFIDKDTKKEKVKTRKYI